MVFPVLAACGGNSDSGPIETDDLDVLVPEQLGVTGFDAFIASVEGNWSSPCLFEPDRLQGPTTGDYVMYELALQEDSSDISYQDYLDSDCLTEWPNGQGGAGGQFPYIRLAETEDGLTVMVYDSTVFISIVEENTSSSFVGSTSSRSIFDIMFLSDSDELFFGDLSTKTGDFSPPTRLDFNSPWTRVPQ